MELCKRGSKGITWSTVSVSLRRFDKHLRENGTALRNVFRLLWWAFKP